MSEVYALILKSSSAVILYPLSSGSFAFLALALSLQREVGISVVSIALRSPLFIILFASVDNFSGIFVLVMFGLKGFVLWSYVRTRNLLKLHSKIFLIISLGKIRAKIFA